MDSLGASFGGGDGGFPHSHPDAQEEDFPRHGRVTMKNHGRGTTERVRICVKRLFLEGMCVRISWINLLIISFILLGGGEMQLAASCGFWKLPCSPVAAPGRCPSNSWEPSWEAGKCCTLTPVWPQGGQRGTRSQQCVLLIPAPGFGASHPVPGAVVSHGGPGTERGGTPPWMKGSHQVGFALLSARRCLRWCCRKTMERVSCVGWLWLGGWGWCLVFFFFCGFFWFCFWFVFPLAEAKAVVAIEMCRIIRQGRLKYLIHIHFLWF